MKKDEWLRCKTVNGPDPNKSGNWCASLHKGWGDNFWCGMEYHKDMRGCPLMETRIKCPNCGKTALWSTVLRGWYCNNCQHLTKENEDGPTSETESN